MPVITVSRGTYSGGKEFAECVAARISAPCLSREILVEAAEKFGVPEHILAEAMNKPPSMLERFSRQRDVYLAFMRATLLQHAATGSFVYHGRAGQLLLTDVVNVIRVRIVAPMSYRVPAAMKRLGIDERKAIAYIEKVDRERERWVRFLYNAQWQDPSLYDLVVNLEQLSIEEACDIVCGMIGFERFAWTDDSRRKVADMALASLVIAELARDERTRGSALDVSCSSGIVTIRGIVRLREVYALVPRIARGVPGVVDVRCQISLHSEIVPD
jgi:cytidylate kinase